MNLLYKIAPTLAVLAVLGYCCWPGAEAPAAPEQEKKREISQASLAPKTAPLPTRDPFLGVAKKLPPTLKEPAKTVRTVAAPVTPADAAKQIASLTLKATFLSGERRLALINNRFYAEGESLQPPTSKTPFVVAEVHANRVVLELEGEQVDLKYVVKPQQGPASSAKTDRKKTKVSNK